MVRKGEKKEENAEMVERNRLKKLALKRNMISESQATMNSALSPSNLVIKHNGKDIIRKSQRSGKNRFLFSFPGLLAPVSGGKIGELKDLGTKNPVLYLDFPQGQMKLFGTIVFPKNRYLTLQFSRGGKNVMCEDYFDNVIVFSEAWWIGRKDENPNEERLEFPEGLNAKHEEFDFKGGAGATYDKKQVDRELQRRDVVLQSSKHELEVDSSDIPITFQENVEVTPTRHSARTAGKTLKFAEDSSGDDTMELDAETSEGEEHAKKSSAVPEKGKKTAKSTSKFKELAQGNQGPLVQATISTLFKKAGEKIAETNGKNKRSDVWVSPRKKVKEFKDDIKAGTECSSGKKSTKHAVKWMLRTDSRSSVAPQVDEDDIEEFSSSSQDIGSSDGDWEASPK